MSDAASRFKQAEVEFKKATAWHRVGKLARAEAGYRQTLRIDPGYTPAGFELLDLLDAGGRVGEALELCRELEDANPLDGGLRSRRSRLQQRAAPPPAGEPGTIAAESQEGSLHVLFYTDHASIYGAEQVNHAVMCGLRATGFRVTCAHAAAHHRLVQERVRRGIAHRWIARDHVYDLSKPARSLFDPEEARAIMRAARPDIVIFGDGCPLSSLMPKHAAAAEGIPFLVIVHCVGPGWADQFARYLPVLADAYRAAAQVIAVSGENLRLLHERFGLDPHKGQVILNGRPATYFAPHDAAKRAAIRNELQIPADALVGVSVARLDWVKGHEYQLLALARLMTETLPRALYLIWAGAGSLDSWLRARVLTLGLGERVRFLGVRSDVAAVLGAADAFLLASHFEGMPVAIMEAMAMGLPVAASAISGIPEELGETGVLLPDPTIDTEATVAALTSTLRFWTVDEGARQHAGAACRARAHALFSEERMVAEYCNLVSSVLVSRDRLPSPPLLEERG